MIQRKEVTKEETKERILNVLTPMGRFGMPILCSWLEQESDFFEAPSSTAFHNAFPGGLAAHSWNVYSLLKQKVEMFQLPPNDDTIAIVGLLHDLCKVGMYEIDADPPTDAQIKFLKDLAKKDYFKIPPNNMTKGYVSKLINFYKNGGDRPEFTESYKVNDKFPIGHGEKSVIIAQRFITLTNEEAMAIRWHMVAFDAGIHFNFPSGYAFREAVNKCALVTLLSTADQEASNILEVDGKCEV